MNPSYIPFSYLNYLARSGMPVKELRDMVTRSISSIPTKFHTSHSIASDDSSLCPGLNPFLDVESRLLHGQGGVWWIDYHYCSQLVEAWLDVLPGKDQLDILEMCLVLQPSNVQLLLRYTRKVFFKQLQSIYGKIITILKIRHLNLILFFSLLALM